MRKSTVKRLERALRLSRPCPECGWPPEKPGDVEIKVSWHDGGPVDDTGIDGEPEEEFCPSCGQPLTITIRWPEIVSKPEGFDPLRSRSLRSLREEQES